MDKIILILLCFSGFYLKWRLETLNTELDKKISKKFEHMKFELDNITTKYMRYHKIIELYSLLYLV